MSEDVYYYASKWVAERQEGQLIEALIELPGYGWEELLDIDFGLSCVVAEIRRAASGNIEQILFDGTQLKAVRRSPSSGWAIEEVSPDAE